MQLPKRKHPRLKEYDYSSNGAYFVTVCVKFRRNILGRIVGRDALIPPLVELTNLGEITKKYIENINSKYLGVCLPKYVIMPNHIHLIVHIHNDTEDGGMRASRPTLNTVIRSLKTLISREIGFGIWQDSFYDHIIRNENAYLQIWQYIDENPYKWQSDEYYCE